MNTFAITLEPGNILIWLAVGFLAGWLASMVMKGGGYGIIGDVIVGLIGAVVGGVLFSLLVPGEVGLLGTIVVAFLGACFLISIFRFALPGRAQL